MSEIQERLLSYIDHIGSNPSDFSLKIGKSRGYVRSITGDITSSILRSIIRIFPDLNIYWLITGEGEMILSEKEQTVIGTINNKELLDRLEMRSIEIGKLINENDLLKKQLGIESQPASKRG